MIKKRGKSLALMLGMALTLTSACVLMPGCSSDNEPTNEFKQENAPSIRSFDEVLDYLKISEQDRALIDSIEQLDVFTKCVAIDKKFGETVRSKKSEAEMDEVEKEYLDALHELELLVEKLNPESEILAALMWKIIFIN